MSSPYIIQILPLPNQKLLLAEETQITGIDNKGFNNYSPNGTYKITASSYASATTLPYMAFNGSDNNYWQCDYNGSSDDFNKKYSKYNTDPFNGKNPATYQGGGSQANTWTTLVGNVSLLGEWLQVKLPYSIFLYNYTIKTPNFTVNSTFPKRFSILGSNDGSMWEYVDQQNVKTPVLNSKPSRVYNINSTKAYSYFRLVISEMPNEARSIMIKQWNMNGVTSITPNPDYKTNESFVTLSRWVDLDRWTSEKEGFQDYGYKPSNSIKYNTGAELKKEVIDNQIGPMERISNDYSISQIYVDTNYISLGNNIKDVTNSDKTGLRDILMRNPMYDFSGNVVDNEKQSKTVVDAQIEDIDSIINQTNTIYILGSITMVTLLIFSVIIGKQ
jgi:hypothetical protein